MANSESRLRIQPVAAPSWIQLGVMVIDGSGSMTLPYKGGEGSAAGGEGKTKAKATEGAIKDFIGRLQRSKNRSNFCLSYVSFNDKVTDRRAPEKVLDMSVDDSYDPTANGIGGTAIHSGLEAAANLVENLLRESGEREVPVSTVVVLMSDGEERDDEEKTRQAAARLKGLAATTLATCLFATKDQDAEGEALLREIASGPEFFQRVYSTEQLRSFFEASITSVPRGLPAGSE